MNGPLSGKTVLAVFAHPDDESLACGGTLARLSDEGARVVLLCASHGELGRIAEAARDGQPDSIRAKELWKAAEALAISDVLLFHHPDGELQWNQVAGLLAEIMMTVRRFKPDAVITFGRDGLYWHRDHIGIFERTLKALSLVGPLVPPVYCVTMPQNVMPSIAHFAEASGWKAPETGFWSLTPDAFGDAADPPTIALDVRAWAEQKLTAIRCHRSQTGPEDPFGLMNADQAREWLGVEHFHRAAIATAMPGLLESLVANLNLNLSPKP
jgi:LmbE family N-acetylglucosaminyl deacetylase